MQSQQSFSKNFSFFCESWHVHSKMNIKLRIDEAILKRKKIRALSDNVIDTRRDIQKWNRKR